MSLRRLVVIIALLPAIISYATLPTSPPYRNPEHATFIFDNSTRIDVNLLDMFVTNHGSFAYWISCYAHGLMYPTGTIHHLAKSAGLWIGALVDGDTTVTVASLTTEYSPGPMVDGSYNPNYIDPHYRVYSIDYNSGPGDPDWDEWPSEEGAPLNELGEPLLLADRTLWCVYNDADSSRHTTEPGETAPLGVEIQNTVFAFDSTEAFGYVIFMKYLIINKGSNYLDDTYVAFWCDADIGNGADDLVGCDLDYWVGYSYNATNNDPFYGSAPPCLGFDVLQGPIVPSQGDTATVSGTPYPNYRNLPMTAFNKIINVIDPRNPKEAYWYMQGLNAVEGEGAPYWNPINGQYTTYPFDGDPVTVTGWIDDWPGQRKFLLASGPFDLEPTTAHSDSIILGITAQEIWMAVIVGHGTDRLSSITEMRANSAAAQEFFDNTTFTSVPICEPKIPDDFTLHQNYPNPFNSTTIIPFEITSPRRVTLTIFNLLGQKVTTLLDENISAGFHHMSWNALQLPSSIYLYRLQTSNFTSTKKMVFLK